MGLGPVEFALVEFPGAQFNGQIAPALAKLTDAGIIRIIDLIFLVKAEDGSITMQELAELDPVLIEAFDLLDGEIGDLLSAEDVLVASEDLSPGSAAALLVWENTWAAGVVSAVRESGGILVAQERIPAALVEAAVLAASVDTASSIES